MVLGGTFKICPIREKLGFESTYARGRIIIARAILDGKLKWTDSLIKQVFTDLLCANCMIHCPLEIDIMGIFKALRSEIMRGKHKLPDGIETVISNIREGRDIFRTLKKRVWWVSKARKINEKSQMVYFAGCVARNKLPNVAQASIKILNAAGLDFSILGTEEHCCGDPLFLIGETELVKELAKHNVEKIRETGADVLVTSCAGCYRVFKTEYPKIIGETGFEVLHISQLLCDLLNKGKISFNERHVRDIVKAVVTYHDPCELGRYCGVYDPPREVIKHIAEHFPGIEFLELKRNRENSWCCGAGGVLKAARPELAVEIAYDTIKEATELGANIITTCCPTCEWNFRDAIRMKKLNMKVLDLAELVAKVMWL